MSIWVSKKEKDGRTSLTAIDINFLYVIMFIGFIAAVVLPNAILGNDSPGWLAVALGFMLLFFSKLPIIIKGNWNSWGPSKMSAFCKVLYFMGYALMAAGIAFILLVYAIHR